MRESTDSSLDFSSWVVTLAWTGSSSKEREEAVERSDELEVWGCCRGRPRPRPFLSLMSVLTP